MANISTVYVTMFSMLFATTSFGVTYSSDSEEAMDEYFFKYVNFSQDASVQQVKSIESNLQGLEGELIGYRFENENLVGEFFVDGEQSLDDFANRFEATFKTQPEFSSAIYLVNEKPSSPVEVNFLSLDEEFVARPAEVPEAALNTDSSPNPSARSSASDRLKWTPETVDATVLRSGNRQHFVLRMSWGENSPKNMPKKFGIEFEINLHNGATGQRPLCGIDAGDKFLAKRQSWYNWYVMVPKATHLKEAEPYADYNDLLDSCGVNSMAVGVRYGARIPSLPNGNYSVITGIEAPIGTAKSNKVSGVIQSVDNDACALLPAPILTDCMGVGQTSYGSQNFLSIERGWVAAPNLCWVSTGYGTQSPRKLKC